MPNAQRSIVQQMPTMLAEPPTVAAHLLFELKEDAPTPSLDDESAGSIVNEVFAAGWRIARGDGQPADPSLLQPAIDHAFWQQVRLVAEQCRIQDDWQRLLAVLLGISLSPVQEKSALYHFSVAPNPSAEHGLRPQRPSRRRRAEATAARGTRASGDGSTGGGLRRKRGAGATARVAIEARIAERKKSRRRLRALLEGAKERTPDEVRVRM